MRAPLPCRWSSRLTTCRPASTFVKLSPSVSSPTTPTIGFAGKRTRSFISIQPFSTRNSRVTGDSTCSISWPKPGMRHAKPTSTGRTSRISAITESPGSAPRMATGPVALFTRSKSISVTRSSSDAIWPVKQSFVSKVTVSPGSTSSTGWRSGPNDQITWSRGRKCFCGISRGDGLVFDVHAVDVGDAFTREDDDVCGDGNAEAGPAERDPIRVLERIRRRGLVVLVVEREEEEDDPADRQDEVQERVELAASLRPVVPHAADTEQHVDDDHERCRER